MYWQTGTAVGQASRVSTDGQPRLIFTVSGLHSFRGADLELLATGNDGAPLPDAWKGNGTGGCNDGSFDYRIGGYGGAYPSAFTGVSGLAVAFNTELFDYTPNPCLTPAGSGFFWLEASGIGAAVKNPALEYGLWALSLDFRGTALGGPVDCAGDQGDPGGPVPVSVNATFHSPCNSPVQGAYIAIVDANNVIDYVPFETGFSNLGWEGPPQFLDLSPPSVTVLSPNGGEAWTADSVVNIQLQANDNVGVATMDLDLSTNGGTSYTVQIAHGIPYSSQYAWTVPHILASSFKIRATVHDAAGFSASDVSDAVFHIVFPPLAIAVTLVSPNGGGTFEAGATFQLVSFVQPGGGTPSTLALWLSTNGGLTYPILVNGSIPYASTLNISTPNVPANHCRFKIIVESLEGSTGSDESDGDFRISLIPDAYVEVLNPNGGQSLSPGAVVATDWYATSSGSFTKVDLALSTDGGLTYPVVLGANLPYPMLASRQWTVPNTPTLHGRLRVTVHDDRGYTATDASDADFIITGTLPAPPGVTLLAPNGGESFNLGSSAAATSSVTAPAGISSMDLALSTDGGATFPIAVATNVAYASPKSWSVPGPLTTHGRLRITVHDGVGNSASDVSDSDFSILAALPAPPQVTVTAPNGGEALLAGASASIASTATAAAGITGTDLALSTDGGATYPVQLATNIPYASPAVWTVPGTPTLRARIRITIHDGNGASASDASDNDFAILPAPGPNDAAEAGLYWEAGSGPGLPSDVSASDMPRLVVTVRGMRSFSGAQVVLFASNNPTTSQSLPAAWMGNGTGGCNEGNFEMRVGGYGGAYASAFTGLPVPVTTENGEIADPADCLTYPGYATFRMKAVAPTGAVRDSATEYGLWAITFDLRGRALGGPVDCAGDLSNTPKRVQILPFFWDQCAAGPGPEAALALYDSSGNVSYAPFLLGKSRLYWPSRPNTSTAVAVSGLNGSAGDGGVILRWALSDPREVVGIRVERAGADASNPETRTVLASGIAPAAEMTFTDAQARSGASYVYSVVASLRDGSEVPASFHLTLPRAEFALRQPSPNPFGASTKIRYSLAAQGSTRLDILDAAGRRVRTLEAGPRGAGGHTVAWDGRDDSGRDAPGGIYFLRLVSGTQRQVQRLVRVH